MRENFKLNSWLIKKLLKENLVFGLGMLILSPVMAYFKGYEDFSYDWLMIKILIGVLIVWNIPALFLMVHYYLFNKNLKLKIDTETEIITIIQNGIQKKYSFNEIDYSIYNVAIYHKNKLDKAFRLKMLISDFGYWDISFKNGNRFFITALIVDFLNKEPFLLKTKTRYRYIPFIDKSIAIKPAKQKDPELSRTEMFVQQYEGKTTKQLNDILQNQKAYQIEAVEAAKIVFKRKNLE